MPDIQIIQFDAATGLASLGMGPSPKTLVGINLLAQVVALAYLRNPGRDVIDPIEGAGLRAEIGQFTSASGEEMKLLFMQRTKFIEKEIIGRQTVGVGDPTEKLKRLVIMDLVASPDEARIVARVRVINEAGGQTDILV